LLRSKRFFVTGVLLFFVGACGTHDEVKGKLQAEEHEKTTVPSAKPDGWRIIDASGYFSFAIPSGLVELDVQGLDSYVRAYRNEDMVLIVDYGMYSARAKNSSEIIDGKNAEILTELRDNEYDGQHYSYISQVRFEDIGEGVVNLVMYAYLKSEDHRQIAYTTFRSIEFRN